MSYARVERGPRENGAMLGFAIAVGFLAWLLFFSPLVAALGSLIPGAGSLAGTFLLTALRFAPLWLIAWFTPRLLGRDSKTLLRPGGRFSSRWLLIGFASWFSLSALMSLIEWVLSPEDFRFTFTWEYAALIVLVALVVFPIQTSAEELVFRGLIPQSLGHVIRKDWLIAVISGLLFAVPHLLNPEAIGSPWLALLAYGSLGAVWSAAVLRTGGLEVALGAHLANNIFALTVVGYEDSALPAISIWTTPPVELGIEVGKGLVGGAIWLAGVYWLSRKRSERGESVA